MVGLLNEWLEWVGLEYCEVSGCFKYLFGIWSKMQCQQKEFYEIYDVVVLWIFIFNVESCYCVLVVVYDIFCLIFGCFKDYIGLLKFNGY